MYILKEVCYLTASITVVHFFYGSVIVIREHSKQSICEGHCVCFTTLVAAIHYSKRSVVNSRKFEGKKSAESYSFEGAYLFHRTSCSNIYLKSTVLNAQKRLQPSHFFMVNLTISQQQLLLLMKYSKFSGRAIVDICACKGDFWSSYFLQRVAVLEYL